MPTFSKRVGEPDYAQRDVLDKLGWRADLALAIDESGGPLDADLRERLAAASALPRSDGESVDLVLVTVTADTDASEVLRRWRLRLNPSGGIWLLTPKRGLAGYVNQTGLIALGPFVGLVDNKVCSVSARTSAIRFVIPRADRPGP